MRPTDRPEDLKGSKTRARKITTAAFLLAVAALMAYGLYRQHQGEILRMELRPEGIMGTQTRLVVYAPRGRRGRVEKSLRATEDRLRALSAKFDWREEEVSDGIAALNRAGAGEEINLHFLVEDLLEDCHSLWGQTDGAFDITVRPLLALWAEKARARERPSDEEIAAARAASNWPLLEVTRLGAIKKAPGVAVDLGGAAKGRAIDMAVTLLNGPRRERSVLVDIGGDLRVYGSPPGRDTWRIGLQDPFDPDAEGGFGVLEIESGAVCTSGHYRRFSEIGGRRYSHILDPRSGRALLADEAPASVTVWAETAFQADAWATALSVLGPEGLEKLPDDGSIEAMVVTGTAEDFTRHCSPGFEGLLAETPE
jgi:thiamine biosynthesis lipoprotein